MIHVERRTNSFHIIGKFYPIKISIIIMIDDEARGWFDYMCGCGNIEQDTEMVDDNKPVTKPIRIGASILLYGKRKAIFPFHCLVGPDYPFVILAYILIITVNGVILGISAPVLGWPPLMIGLLGFIGILISFTITVFSDPGIIYRNDYELRAINSNNDNNYDVENQGITNRNHQEIDNNKNDDFNEPLTAGIVQSVTPPQTSPSNNTNSNTSVMPSVPPATMECGQCRFQRPYSARHCAYCENCIDKLDHHCPW